MFLDNVSVLIMTPPNNYVIKGDTVMVQPTTVRSNLTSLPREVFPGPAVPIQL